MQPHQIYPVQNQLPLRPPANQGYKMAAIMLFVFGYFLKVIGFFTLAILIGIFPLLLGVACDILAFIFLCLI